MAIEFETTVTERTRFILYSVKPDDIEFGHATTDEEFDAAARAKGYSKSETAQEIGNILAGQAIPGDRWLSETLQRIIRERDEAKKRLTVAYRGYDDLVAKLKRTEAQLRETCDELKHVEEVREGIHQKLVAANRKLAEKDFGVSRFVKVAQGLNENKSGESLHRAMSSLIDAMSGSNAVPTVKIVETAATYLLNWLWTRHPENTANSTEINKAKDGLGL